MFFFWGFRTRKPKKTPKNVKKKPFSEKYFVTVCAIKIGFYRVIKQIDFIKINIFMTRKDFRVLVFWGPRSTKFKISKKFFIKILVIKIRFFRGIGKGTVVRFA